MHINDDTLELYLLGYIPKGPRFDAIEEHILACPACVSRAEEMAHYVDAMRAAAAELRRRCAKGSTAESFNTELPE